MYLSEICKIVNALPPIGLDGGPMGAAYVNMGKYNHITMIIQGGVSAGAVSTITVEKDADGSGAGTAIAFSYRACLTAYDAAGGDTLAAPVLIVGAGGVAMSGTDNIFYVIEIDAADLGPTFPYIRAYFSDAAAAQLGSCLYILSGARHQGLVNPTALTV